MTRRVPVLCCEPKLKRLLEQSIDRRDDEFAVWGGQRAARPA
jgi:hypothetical protein